ncbi:hypothetical protein JG687_00016670 [Phytophthora cactorum]|uniref:Uncharacterized protein n=1 Tax=Phytophthora cactorum TaxID=29920 RepID=A0A8T1JNK1_9STRA|nr:hypothetical protein GQ600_4797 [Phytophthora cactorum]KAG2877942.1 hypothetical protein PC114_g23388 [Phytophthora cactorum]KAG2981028.1 hypothetical protein PC119_g21140 [Phytophthora cactorum]KAG3170697.1 hypothetical protein PC128_g18901 [Phytophthora cactorum]KAG4040970.1 hypothetical protein PC123_g23504 [Phytophthora cactorum]
MPIVLHYAGNHYHAYIHGVRNDSTDADRSNNTRKDEDVEMANVDHEDHVEDGSINQPTPSQDYPDQPMSSPVGTFREKEHHEEKSEEYSPGEFGSQSPWDPDTWTGNIEEIERRMEGPTILHSLKQEVHKSTRF